MKIMLSMLKYVVSTEFENKIIALGLYCFIINYRKANGE